MNGADYIAQNRITTKAGEVLAMPGDTCERVPISALEWLSRPDPQTGRADVVHRDTAPAALVSQTPVVDSQVDTFPLPDPSEDSFPLGDEEH